MAGVGATGGTQTFASTLTDLMTSLAVIFILLLVVFLKQAHNQGNKAREEVKDGLSSILEQKNLKVQQDPDDPFKLTVMMGELHAAISRSGTRDAFARGARIRERVFQDLRCQNLRALDAHARRVRHRRRQHRHLRRANFQSGCARTSRSASNAPMPCSSRGSKASKTSRRPLRMHAGARLGQRAWIAQPRFRERSLQRRAKSPRGVQDPGANPPLQPCPLPSFPCPMTAPPWNRQSKGSPSGAPLKRRRPLVRRLKPPLASQAKPWNSH